MSKFILTFAQLSIIWKRPLVDLDFAVQDLNEDLKEMQEEVSQDIFQKISITSRIIDELDVFLGNAQIEISNNLNFAENALKNQIVSCVIYEIGHIEQQAIIFVRDFVSQNRAAIQREDLMHQINSKKYQEKITDHQTCIEDFRQGQGDCIKVHSRRIGYNQRDSAQRCLNKRYGNQPLVTALIESVPNFENKKQLKKIRQKLVKVKQAVQDQYYKNLFHDKTQKSLYEKRKAQLEKDHSIFYQQIADNMTQSYNSIQEWFQDMRRDDVKRYAQQSQDENETFCLLRNK